jgi:hypothetical protein
MNPLLVTCKQWCVCVCVCKNIHSPSTGMTVSRQQHKHGPINVPFHIVRIQCVQYHLQIVIFIAGGPYGENLAMSSSTTATMTSHVNNWFSEINGVPGALPTGLVAKFASTPAGHYTQVRCLPMFRLKRKEHVIFVNI